MQGFYKKIKLFLSVQQKTSPKMKMLKALLGVYPMLIILISVFKLVNLVGQGVVLCSFILVFGKI